MSTPLSLDGKTVLLTGATSGIGRETARALARTGATLVLGARDRDKAAQLVEELKRDSGNAQISALVGDLSSLKSVRAMAREFLARHQRLHILINNAGLVMTRRELSADGYERTFATNHLGPFLLTGLLLDTLKASAPARIINVASQAHRRGRMHWDDLQLEKGFNAIAAYGQSKLCNILFTAALAQRLEGTAVTANSLHPGVVRTGFGHNTSGWLRWAVTLFAPFMIGSEQGAQTTIYLATAPQVEGISGKYWLRKRQARPTRLACDARAAERLWQESLRLTSGKGFPAAAKKKSAKKPTRSARRTGGRR